MVANRAMVREEWGSYQLMSREGVPGWGDKEFCGWMVATQHSNVSVLMPLNCMLKNG
jgi:hypothetical protein